MCLAIPGKIIEIKEDKVIVDYGSEKREARLLDKSFKVGDYVIVGGKIVLDRISEQEALEAIKAWESLK
ncbi:MAG: HypC/HybG/HupF family hydrogenase formation chaperone [Candidatus Woesearchaeota archaeon]|nr:HypC/HybG/HupF family hydrogenase formation chaperone [Candidatus Woesearchaeota archaeon]